MDQVGFWGVGRAVWESEMKRKLLISRQGMPSTGIVQIDPRYSGNMEEATAYSSWECHW